MICKNFLLPSIFINVSHIIEKCFLCYRYVIKAVVYEIGILTDADNTTNDTNEG